MANVNVSPEILNWAIKESTIPYESIENKFPKISKWIEQVSMPTFKQLKELSAYLHIPFGYMFLTNPPKSFFNSPEFRTINNKTNNEISKDLKDVLCEMEYKKDWMSEYRRLVGDEKITFPETISIQTHPKKVSKVIQQTLQLNNNWFEKKSNPETYYRFLRDAIESFGVLVMQSGVVGQNNKRKLDIKEFRAFVLNDEYAPLIFINRHDSYSGMIFSLIHEFIHIMLEEDDIVNDVDNSVHKERIINKFTAEFLMPEEYIKTKMIESNEISIVDYFTKIFAVSPFAVAIRLNELGYINRNTVEIIKERTEKVLSYKKSNNKSNPDFYTVKASQISGSFARAIISQVDNSQMSFTDAYKMLGVKGASYKGLVNYLRTKEIKNV